MSVSVSVRAHERASERESASEKQKRCCQKRGKKKLIHIRNDLVTVGKKDSAGMYASKKSILRITIGGSGDWDIHLNTALGWESLGGIVF